MLGKLDGVGDQVHQDLAQAGHIANDGFRRARIKFIEEIEPLFRSFGRDQIKRFFDAGAQIERALFELQFARFDFGKI